MGATDSGCAHPQSLLSRHLFFCPHASSKKRSQGRKLLSSTSQHGERNVKDCPTRAGKRLGSARWEAESQRWGQGGRHRPSQAPASRHTRAKARSKHSARDARVGSTPTSCKCAAIMATEDATDAAESRTRNNRPEMAESSAMAGPEATPNQTASTKKHTLRITAFDGIAAVAVAKLQDNFAQFACRNVCKTTHERRWDESKLSETHRGWKASRAGVHFSKPRRV